MSERSLTWQEEMDTSRTWQEEMNTPTWLGFTAVGFVPLLGPIIHLGVNVHDGCYKMAALNAAVAMVDVCSLGAATQASNAASSASAARSAFTETMQSGSIWTIQSLKVAAEAASHAEAAKATSIVLSNAANSVRVCNGVADGVQTIPYGVFGETCPTSLANLQVPGTLPTPGLTPAESDGRAFIPVAKQPRRTLQASNFLRFYCMFPRHPSLVLLRGHVQGHVLSTFEQCLHSQGGHLGEAAARLWSFAAPAHYKAINNAIITDNAGLLQHWTPLIRILNNYMLSFHLPSDTITRRKSWLDRSEAIALVIGTIYRIGMYCATSRKSWASFPGGLGGNQVRWEFTVPRSCFQACDIERASAFGALESEVLFVPFTPVLIDAVVTCSTTGVVTIYATLPRDGKALPDNLPTIMA